MKEMNGNDEKPLLFGTPILDQASSAFWPGLELAALTSSG
jgi:hypothetical protein